MAGKDKKPKKKVPGKKEDRATTDLAWLKSLKAKPEKHQKPLIVRGYPLESSIKQVKMPKPKLVQACAPPNPPKSKT